MTRRILVVDDRLPIPERDGASVRMIHLLGLLQDLAWTVTFAAHERHVGDWDVRLRVRDVEVLPEALPVASHLAEAGDRYDAVILSRPGVADDLLEPVRRHAPAALLIYDTLDLHFLREFRLARHHRNLPALRHALERKRQELDLVGAADRTFVVSSAERGMLADLCPGATVDVVSNIHDPRPSTTPFENRDGVAFIGTYTHPPNPDAAKWILDEIWPRVRALEPGLTLFVIGGSAPDWLRARDGEPGVRIVGHVPDLGPWHERARLSIAPLRFGSGVKGKVLDSLARGLPVVGTTLAFEGIPVVSGQDGLVADDPDELAAAVVRVHGDARLWDRLSANGLRLVERGFSSAVARAALERALQGARHGQVRLNA
jgi:O-antigen biosynthesis protein